MAKSVAEIFLITWSYINIILFYFKLICVFIGICVGDKERDVQKSLNKWEIEELKALMQRPMLSIFLRVLHLLIAEIILQTIVYGT